jgi:hypothetical protein
MFIYEPIVIPDAMPEEAKMWALRLNGFGSMFFFVKNILKRKRMTRSLHLPICNSLEKAHLKDVKEYPRDHFKSTIASEGFPIWRVLPFGDRDEEKFRQFHQGGLFRCDHLEEFLRWMRVAHNPNRRSLLVSENLENARKLGTRIRRHFESGDAFRLLYPEIIPGTSEKWTDTSLQIRVPGGAGPHGEATFDFIGSGGALQSRHYHMLIQDDLVGMKTVESPSIMERSYEYHQLLVGAFDEEDPNHEADELVIGNRWGYHDLNSQIKEHEPWFEFETHSALGGCCDAHPHGVPIFSEEFSAAKLMRLRQRLGSYKFSCQFENRPVAPDDADFRESWLNYFELKRDSTGARFVHHEVKDGRIRRDVPCNQLRIAMATDPTHSQNAGQGRCRHSIVVLGMSQEGGYYMLDCWAKQCTYEEYFNKLFDIAKDWGLHKVGFEISAGQGLGAHHLQYMGTVKGYRLQIQELKGEVELSDGTISTKKEWRIRGALSPIFELGRFFTQRRWTDFLGEYSEFPKSRFCDILDATAYIPQLLRNPLNQVNAAMLKKINREMAGAIGQPYSAGVRGIYHA